MNPILEDERELSQPGSFAMNLTTVALTALSSKSLVWCTVLGGIVLWGYIVLDPSWIKIVSAIGYAATILVPVIVRDVKETRR